MKSWQVALVVVVLVGVLVFASSSSKPKTAAAPAPSSSNNVYSALGGLLGGAITAIGNKPAAPSAAPSAAYNQGYGAASAMSDQQLSDSINQGQAEEDSFTNPFAGTLFG